MAQQFILPYKFVKPPHVFYGYPKLEYETVQVGATKKIYRFILQKKPVVDFQWPKQNETSIVCIIFIIVILILITYRFLKLKMQL